jgi:hypothetical protein
MEGLVLEVLEPDERAPTRLKLDTFPVTIGRAVDNTVVLDDPEVSAHHARIERGDDGLLTLLDNQSANGIFDLRAHAKVLALPLAERSKVRLGGTVLRLRAASERLERTVISRVTMLPDVSVFRHRWLAPVLALAAAGMFLGGQVAATYRYVEPARLLFGAVALLLAVVVWSAAWALVSKQLRRRFHFLEHAAVAATALLGLGLAALVESYLSYWSPWPLLPRLLDQATTAALLSWVSYRHLNYCSPWSPRLLKFLSALAGVVLVGTVELYQLANAPHFRSQPTFPAAMKPASLRLGRAQPVDDFFNGARSLKEQADDSAHKD